MASDLSANEPQPDRTEPSTSRGRARRIVARAAVALLTAGALVHPTATLLSRSSWRAELLCHFPLPGLAVTLTALAAALRRRRVGVALAVLGVLQASPRVHCMGPNPVPPGRRCWGRRR